MGFVQIAVVQRSKASHSELVTNITTMICVAVRHCQPTSNSVTSPHKNIAGWPSHFLNKKQCLDTVVLAWLVCKTQAQGRLGNIDIALTTSWVILILPCA